MTQANFKYTFPIAKAEARADGLYLVGYASGPEIDTEGERMAPEAITRFSEQINSAPDGMKLVYRDAHAPDGVLRDLGEITKAWVTEKFHLGVEVKLEDTNPASTYLFRSIKEKGKQYGMSVAGHVVDYAMEFVDSVGKSVLTYKDVVLDEISNTTRPAWYPSFGTVLSKSIKDASLDASTGDNELSTTATDDLLDDVVVEDAEKSADADTSAEDLTEKTDDAVVDETEVEKTSASNDASSAAYIEASLINLLGGEAGEPDDEGPLRVALAAVQQYIAQEVAEIGTPEDTAASDYGAWSESDKALADELAKAGKKLSAATAAELLSLHETMTTTLTSLGVIAGEVEAEGTSSEKAASEDGEDTTEKTDSEGSTEPVVSKSELDALTALAKANERIAELEARPATALPGVINDETKKTAEDELVDALAKASPANRLRLAFAAHTGGK